MVTVKGVEYNTNYSCCDCRGGRTLRRESRNKPRLSAQINPNKSVISGPGGREGAMETPPCLTWARLVLVLVLAVVCCGRSEDGGWRAAADPALDDGGRCNIPVLDGDQISYGDFLDRFAYSRPVILRGVTDNSRFRELCSKQSLLKEYGERTVRLSTANTYSYRKVDVSFRTYVEELMKPQPLDALGNDSLYLFGDNNFSEWRRLFSVYQAPPFSLPHTTQAFSFGIAGAGTGVPFHWHGPGYSEVIYGRKRWFLYPPEKEPHFDPDVSALSWVTHTLPSLPLEEAPLDCTIHPGEVLYFPDRWWHATLNLDTSVFISTFLG